MTPVEHWQDDLHDRVKHQRERALALIGTNWHPWDQPVEDGPAEMIALNTLLREGVIEADAQWRLRHAR